MPPSRIAAVEPALPIPTPERAAVNPMRDRQVAPASFAAESTPIDRVLLDPHKPTPVESLDLLPGQTITAAEGARAELLISGGPLRIGMERLRFERIDFVFERDAAVQLPPSEPTLLEFSGEEIEFHECTFRIRGGQTPLATAIRWNDSPASGPRSLLPGGRIELTRCRVAGMSAVLAVQRRGELLLDAEHLLHVGPGPLVRLSEFPTADSSLRLRLTHATVRGAAVCHGTLSPGVQPGRFTVETRLSVFDPGSRHAVIEVAGPESAADQLSGFSWEGEGSLLASSAEFLGLDRAGRLQPLADSALAVSGLVRSRLEFAGELSSEPGDSHLLAWQAPLPSGAQPGYQEAGAMRTAAGTDLSRDRE